MGMLVDFYTGDKNRIVKAWKSGKLASPEEDTYVFANADLSFNLSTADLDQLMFAASSLLQSPQITFAESIHEDLDGVSADSEEGIHEMTDAFTDLFATIPLERTTELYQIWCANMQEQPRPGTGTGIKKHARRIKRNIETALFGLIFGPMLVCAWLFSPSFRKDRARNKAKRELQKADFPKIPAYTMKEAIEALIYTCQTAKSGGNTVIYVWSL